jgi:hypothetical protein
MDVTHKMYPMLVAIFAVMAIAMATPSHAAVFRAMSTIYFDGNGNIIGQKILYCNGLHTHAGITSSTNMNRLNETWGCGSVRVSCDWTTVNGMPTEFCGPSGYDYGHLVEYFQAANGYTYQQYCDSPIGYSPFYGHPTCDMPAPAHPLGFGPYYNGW